ncbi:hypothetical protein HNY73_011902 [Argiope bruennichi]|uniref:CD80-like immunoglobulin C2-set domain-containing protein n=1 Tax=Argiope bruennichi TaxID=94029 RepID=A0A8T0EUU4_ARGBR|nr:hypothetical protein HNY73_011902 [Argiope bruennichi]
MSSEEIIVGDNAKASAVVGDGPVITGGKPKYQKGDTVDVNCTSAKSNPPAELRWYINDKPVRAEFLLRYKPVRYGKSFFPESVTRTLVSPVVWIRAIDNNKVSSKPFSLGVVKAYLFRL